MSKTINNKGRSKTGQFLMLPHSILYHANYALLSPKAVKLLIDIAGQYTGYNNGGLITTSKYLYERGWRSNDQINKAKKELLKGGWIVETRKGRRPRVASLYAITWRSIDECKGKLERAETRAPLNWWRMGHNPEEKLDPDPRHKVHTEPPHGAMAVNDNTPLNRSTVHNSPKTKIHCTATR